MKAIRRVNIKSRKRLFGVGGLCGDVVIVCYAVVEYWLREVVMAVMDDD